MNLLSFAKKTLQTVKNDAQSAKKVVQRDVAAPVSHAAGNVVNALSAHSINNFADSNLNPVTATRNLIVQPVVHQAGALGSSVADIVRGAAADITHNPVALANANAAKVRNEGAFLQPMTRPIIQTVKTIEHPLTPNNYQAKGKDAKIIFGDTPVQNIAAGVKSNYDAHSNLPTIPRTLLAGAYGTGQVAQDVLTLAGAKAGGEKLATSTKDLALSKVKPVSAHFDPKAAVPLPEDHAAYFKPTANTETVPIEKLISSKTPAENAKGAANAPALMAKAANGEIDKRAPITVAKQADGTYKVLDGNGTFTAVKAQGWKSLPVHVVNEAHYNAANDLIKSAKAADPAFQSGVQRVTKAFGLNYIPGPVKSVARTLEKGATDYGGDFTKLKDTIRGTIPVPNIDNTQSVIEALGKQFQIERVKNFKSDAGYYDIKVNLKTADGHVGEVILTTPEMLDAKNGAGHKLYEAARVSKDPAEKAQLVAKMQELYGQAHEAASSRRASSGDLPNVSSSTPIASPSVTDMASPIGGMPTTLDTPVNTRVSSKLPSGRGVTDNSTSSPVKNSLRVESSIPSIIDKKATDVKVPKTDQHGFKYTEQQIAPSQLTRDQNYQPRTTESGKATENSVYQKGYNEGQVQQPILVAKQGDKYTVLGGHSRTLGLQRRATEGLPNPETIKARVYDNLTTEQARQVSRGANQGPQYENTLDMAKSISESIADKQTPAVQKANLIKGFNFDDYHYLWKAVSKDAALKAKIFEGAMPADEVLAIMRTGRTKNLEPTTIAGIINSLEKAGKFNRTNATNVINMLSGKIKANIAKDSQTGLFGTVEQAVKSTDLLAEHKKVSADLTKRRNAVLLASGEVKGSTQKELQALVKTYDAKLKSVSAEIAARYKGDAVSTPAKTFVSPKRMTKDDAPAPLSALLKNKQAELKTAAATQTKRAAKLPDAAKPQSPQLPTKLDAKLAKDSSVQNKFTKGAKQGKQNVSPEVQSKVDTSHVVRNTKTLQANASTKADSAGLDKTIADAQQALQAPLGKIDDKVVADAQQAIERADTAGRIEDAVNLHDQLSEHLTKQGQSIQAASLFYKLSPQGQLYKALRDIKKGDGKVTPELEAKLREQVDAIKTAKEGDAKDFANAKFHKTVREAIPQSNIQGALSIWKAGLLSGAKTHTGNALSNGVFGLLKKVSDIPAAAVDKALSLGTKERTKTFTTKGIISGTKTGAQKGYRTLRTGIDTRDVGSGGKYDGHGELNFKNPVIQNVFGKPSNLVFRAMNAGDQPFYFAAARNTLEDRALAAAKTQGLTGRNRRLFIKDFVENPSKKEAELAKLAAQKAVLGQDSKFAASLSHLAQEHPVVQAIVPFIKVPTNFLTRTLDYTPVGAVKGLVKAGLDKKAGRDFNQRAFSEAIGEATTGSAFLYIGAEMANNRLLSGAYPTDPKEQQRWKAEGITPNSIKLGDKWISLNYLGPLGLLLNAGKEYHDAAAQGNSAYMQALGSFGKNLAGQSFLQGFSSFANALTDPGRYLTNLKNSEAGSLIPSWSNDLANLIDKNQRQASTVPQTIQSKIPGLRNKLPVKQDVYGNNLPQRTNPAQLTVDPSRPSNTLGKDNPVIQEVNRLHTVDPNNKDLQVTPVPVTSLSANNNNGDNITIKLTASQKYDLNNKVGQAIQTNWGKLIATPTYQALPNAEKAKALNSLRTDTTTLIERKYVTDNNLGVYNKAPSKSVLALGGASSNLKTYTDKASGIKNTKTGYPTIPKDPNAKPAPSAIKTTYDPTTKTWTQTSSLTGRTVHIATDGTRTVVNEGVRTKKASTSTKTTTSRARSTKLKLAKIPRITSNPYKTNKKTYKVAAMPKFTTGRKVSFKTAKISTNISAKLHRA